MIQRHNDSISPSENAGSITLKKLGESCIVREQKGTFKNNSSDKNAVDAQSRRDIPHPLLASPPRDNCKLTVTHLKPLN